MNQLLKTLYFDDELQGKVNEAIDGLDDKPIGESTVVDEITVTKDSDEVYTIEKGDDKAVATVTENGVEIGDVTGENFDDKEDVYATVQVTEGASPTAGLVKGEPKGKSGDNGFFFKKVTSVDEANDFLKDYGYDSPYFGKEESTEFFSIEDDQKGTDIKTLLFSDEELEASEGLSDEAKVALGLHTPAVQEVINDTLKELPAEVIADTSAGEINELGEQIDAVLTNTELALFSEVSECEVSGWDQAKKIAVAAFNKFAKPTKEALKEFIKQLEETAANAPGGGTGGKMFDDMNNSDDLNDPEVSTADLFKKEAVEKVVEAAQEFNPEMTNEELYKVANRTDSALTLEQECKAKG